ncbi:hypothetical protein ACLKA6_000273 [Drosophila palustris]
MSPIDMTYFFRRLHLHLDRAVHSASICVEDSSSQLQKRQSCFVKEKLKCEFVLLPDVPPRQTVSKAIRRFRPGRGRKSTVNHSSNRQIIRKRVKRNPRVSMSKIAPETGMKRESVRQMVKKHLGLKPYKLQKVQLQLKRRAAGQRWERILFTDEKLFIVEQSHNHQSDRIWSVEAPGTSAIVEHRQNPNSTMVFNDICNSGKTPSVYDSAPAHKSKMTKDWCKTHFPDFISSAEWPPYSPDLNPMDYCVWSILEARAYAKPHKSLEAVKQSLLLEWDRLDRPF